ncbi:hypothetical protein HELRODRAFT_180710 [Helobdella robusta]|uniref:Uncharacterized protein n=1 Tax=Helobdella robusta TaxID=6412 RepID=T1FG70_HELRO|nr:hypothetical protein HELRODRAFT_180710 [Helobdella robusta]ESN93620.1 hypothetical protein HELRODRAFT_180710 [Helobdella robusta]
MMQIKSQEEGTDPDDLDESVKTTAMLSNLCNIQAKVNKISEKMRELADMNHSGMNTVTRINRFQDQLEQLQCMVSQDLYKTGEVARCQYKLINDIERFMDMLKCEETRLRSICYDLPQEAPQQPQFQLKCCCNMRQRPSQQQSQLEQGSKSDCCYQQESHAKSGDHDQCLTSGFQKTRGGSNCPGSQGMGESNCCGCQKEEKCNCYRPQGTCEFNSQGQGIREMNPSSNQSLPISMCGIANNRRFKSVVYISDLHPMGKFVKISNADRDRIIKSDSCPGREYYLHFRFPLRVQLPPADHVKVWSACFDPGVCKSPADFVALGVSRQSPGLKDRELTPDPAIKNFRTFQNILKLIITF